MRIDPQSVGICRQKKPVAPSKARRTTVCRLARSRLTVEAIAAAPPKFVEALAAALLDLHCAYVTQRQTPEED